MSGFRVTALPSHPTSSDMHKIMQNSGAAMAALEQEIKETTEKTKIVNEQHAKVSAENEAIKDAIITSQTQTSILTATCSHLKLTISTKEATLLEVANQVAVFQTEVGTLEDIQSEQRKQFLKESLALHEKLADLRNGVCMQANA